MFALNLTQQRSVDAKVLKDMRTLALFVETYCRHQHAGTEKNLCALKGFNVEQLAGRPIELCPDCRKLLNHALVKRSVCPMDPKPACKHCPNHCYHPDYRRQMQQVMRFSGKKLLLGGRLDYLFHLLF